MSKIYYHLTPKDNISSILENGIRASYDGYTYMCDNPYEPTFFIPHHLPGLFTPIPIRIYEGELLPIETVDNKMIKRLLKGQYLYPGDIPKDRIIMPIGVYIFIIPSRNPLDWYIYSTETKQRYAYPFWEMDDFKKIMGKFGDEHGDKYKGYLKDKGYNIIDGDLYE